MRRSPVLFGLAAALVLASAIDARAEGASSAAAAQALFDEGKRLMAAGALAEACPKFAESQKLDPGAGTLVNLGACYERNGQTASAWATYAEAAATADKTGRTDWATRARQRAAALAPTLSKLSIVVPHTSEVAGLEIKRDGATIGSVEWAVPIPVDPGPHVIEAGAPNKKRWITTVQVGATKDQVAVTVPPLEDASTAPPPPAVEPPPVAPRSAPASARPSSGGSQRTLGVGIAAAGVVGVAIGTVFGLKAKSSQDDAKGACNADQSACNATGVAAMSDAHSSATISTLGFIVGGAALAGGAVLYFMAPRSEPRDGVRVHSLQVGAVGRGAGVTLGGSW